MWALKIGGTLAGLGYVLWKVDFGEVTQVIVRVSPYAFLAACALTGANLIVGALRWRILLAAYGAPHRPPLLHLARVYLVGFFYNNYLPGGLGGDFVRAIVTRASFGAQGAATQTTASMTVVFVERVLGLAGLLLLVSGAYLVRPLPGTEGVLPISGLFLLGAVAAVALLALSRRIAPVLPGRLGSIAAALPALERPLPFVGALGLSLCTQAVVALTGWVLMVSITRGAVTLGDALVLVPLAMASAYFPFSVGGSGVREAAFVALGTRALGMSEADALASSLLLWISQLAVGGLGGIAQLVAPLSGEASDS